MEGLKQAVFHTTTDFLLVFLDAVLIGHVRWRAVVAKLLLVMSFFDRHSELFFGGHCRAQTLIVTMKMQQTGVQ